MINVDHGHYHNPYIVRIMQRQTNMNIYGQSKRWRWWWNTLLADHHDLMVAAASKECRYLPLARIRKLDLKLPILMIIAANSFQWPSSQISIWCLWCECRLPWSNSKSRGFLNFCSDLIRLLLKKTWSQTAYFDDHINHHQRKYSRSQVWIWWLWWKSKPQSSNCRSRGILVLALIRLLLGKSDNQK